MKVIFNTSIAGENFSYRPKREYDLLPHLAERYIKAGAAKASEPPAPALITRVRRGARRVRTAMTGGAPETR